MPVYFTVSVFVSIITALMKLWMLLRFERLSTISLTIVPLFIACLSFSRFSPVRSPSVAYQYRMFRCVHISTVFVGVFFLQLKPREVSTKVTRTCVELDKIIMYPSVLATNHTYLVHICYQNLHPGPWCLKSLPSVHW